MILNAPKVLRLAILTIAQCNSAPPVAYRQGRDILSRDRRPVSRENDGVLAAKTGALSTVGLAATGVVLHIADGDAPGNHDLMAWWLVGATAAVAYGLTGAWLVTVRPRLTVGWLLLAIGLCQAIGFAGPQYAVHVGGPEHGAGAALWVGNWTWRTGYALLAFMVPLFVTTRKPHWWPAAAATLANTVQAATVPYTVDGPSLAVTGLHNPTGLAPSPLWLTVAVAALSVPAAVLVIVSIVESRWLALGLLATAALFGLGFAFGPVLTAAAMLPLPLAVLAAAQHFGRWGADLALSRALRWALVLAVALVGYLAVVDLGGSPLIAVAGIALAAAPLDRLLRPRVNRLVHGRHDDPYAVLARIGGRLAAASDATTVSEQLLPDLVQTLAGTLRLRFAGVEFSGGDLVSSGTGGAGIERIPLHYGGAVVGTLLVDAGPGGLSRGARRLLDPLAASAAVAVHTVALTRDLERSRQALVTAREEERRRLYRELHDGFGPVLAATALQAETARDLLDTDPQMAAKLLDKVVPQLRGTVDDVRGIVHGLRPPALDDLGLGSAVRELAGRFATARRKVDIDVSLDGLPGPVSAAVEVAAYRIMAEALTNVSRHADADRVAVTLRRDGEGLRLTVTDDGVGVPAVRRDGLGLASMHERAKELRGSLVVGAGAGGRGTLVDAWLPLEGAEA
jgi:signal transduction histidine kinase